MGKPQDVMEGGGGTSKTLMIESGVVGGGGTYFPQLLGAENGGLTLEERFVGRATRVFPSLYPSLNK
jgi:hypothetical protein